ncbi:MAG TPA: hypothetical protein PKM88_12640, partial [bacterium]|nr:hypothetical protein [bacterium]
EIDTGDAVWCALALADGFGTVGLQLVVDARLAMWLSSANTIGAVALRLTATDEYGMTATATCTAYYDAVCPSSSIGWDGAAYAGDTNSWVIAPTTKMVLACDQTDAYCTYALNDGVWHAYAEPVCLPPGVINLSVRTADRQGNWGATQKYDVYVDAEPPSTPLLSGLPNSMMVGLNGIHLTCAGDNGSVVTISFSSDKSEWHNLVLENEHAAYWETRELAEGKYWLRTQACDWCGNVSAESIVGPVTVDLTPPLALADETTNGIDSFAVFVQHGAAHITTAEAILDTGTGFAGYLLYSADTETAVGANGALAEIARTGSTLDYYLLAPPTGGPHYFAVAGRDKAGNISPLSCVAEASFPADQTAPVANRGFDPQAVDVSVSSITGSIALAVTWATDVPYDQYGVDHYQIYRCRQSPVYSTAAEGVICVANEYRPMPNSCVYIDTVNLTEGMKYYYAVIPVDVAGNTGAPFQLPLKADDVRAGVFGGFANVDSPAVGWRLEVWGGENALLAAYDAVTGWQEGATLAEAQPLRLRFIADCAESMPIPGTQATLKLPMRQGTLRVCLPENIDHSWGTEKNLWVSWDGSTWHACEADDTASLTTDALHAVGELRLLAAAADSSNLPQYP